MNKIVILWKTKGYGTNPVREHRLVVRNNSDFEYEGECLGVDALGAKSWRESAGMSEHFARKMVSRALIAVCDETMLSMSRTPETLAIIDLGVIS